MCFLCSERLGPDRLRSVFLADNISEWRVYEHPKFAAKILSGGSYANPDNLAVLVQRNKVCAECLAQIKRNIARLEKCADGFNLQKLNFRFDVSYVGKGRLKRRAGYYAVHNVLPFIGKGLTMDSAMNDLYAQMY